MHSSTLLLIALPTNVLPINYYLFAFACDTQLMFATFSPSAAAAEGDNNDFDFCDS